MKLLRNLFSLLIVCALALLGLHFAPEKPPTVNLLPPAQLEEPENAAEAIIPPTPASPGCRWVTVRPASRRPS